MYFELKLCDRCSITSTYVGQHLKETTHRIIGHAKVAELCNNQYTDS